MEPRTTPPPYRPVRQPVSYGSKVFNIGAIAVLLMICAAIVWGMSASREERSETVVTQIRDTWGGDVEVAGPVVKIAGDSVAVVPLRLDCTAEVESQTLHRNIYEAEVFTGNVNLSGCFSRKALTSDTVTVVVDIPAKSVSNPGVLTIGGREVNWTVGQQVLTAVVDVRAFSADTLSFTAHLAVRGSGKLSFVPLAGRTAISISGSASEPSFVGGALPDERTVGDGAFSAVWKGISPVSAYEDYNDEEEYDEYAYDDEHVSSRNVRFFGTKFLVGVDRYRKVDRALKYAFIIILLTFVSVFVAEILLHRPVPILNYFLIGAALVIFYTLLLAFVEYVPFGVAYLIASVMTVVLVTVYFGRMLRPGRTGLVIGALLAVMYGACYVMLTVASWAMLMGSLLLFAAVAAMMHVSLRIPRH